MEQFNLEKYLKNPSRRVVTREGRDVRIIATDRQDEWGFCVVGLAFSHSTSTNESIFAWKRNGSWDGNKKSKNDLFFAPKKCEGWVNIFSLPAPEVRTDECVYDSYEEAVDFAKKNPLVGFYVATVKVEWEE